MLSTLAYRWSSKIVVGAIKNNKEQCSVAGFTSLHLKLKYQNYMKTRSFSSEAEMEPRDAMEYDVVTVGAGPAGLSAAIRLKQLALEKDEDLSICVIEKGAEVGAHILSGNVFEPRALNELFPDWKEMGAPIDTEVTEDAFLVLPDDSKSYQIPNVLLPPSLHNEGNYIVSLSQLTRWLAEQAEELGVEIYAGFAASEVVYKDDGSVAGIATRDVGLDKDGTPKDTFERGIELRGRQTIFAEGCRGSCTEEVIKNFDLRKDCNPQTYGLGVKEVWEIPDENHKPGFVQHTLGWPLQSGLLDKNFGGSFLYHMKPNLVLVGFVVGLDYENPYLNPYKEFQRWKHHPDVSKHLDGGECISYGARCLNEGGYHSIPKLTVPGGVLVGCAAGFLNSVKIKGTHTAMKSGMLAAEAMYEVLTKDSEKTVLNNDGEIDKEEMSYEITNYENEIKNSWVYEELKEIRNVHASFANGVAPGLAYAGVNAFVMKGREPWTLNHTVKDCDTTKKASECKEIEYPKPDGKLSFDLLTNLQRSGTNHNHDQPAHLRVKIEHTEVPEKVSLPEYAGPEQRFCPAGVYEYTEEGKLVINAQNCVHCKCCSIKMPKEYINWTVPEGSGGPAYTVM